MNEIALGKLSWLKYSTVVFIISIMDSKKFEKLLKYNLSNLFSKFEITLGFMNKALSNISVSEVYFKE